MKIVNDLAIYMRALLFGNIYVLEDSIGNYRVHSDNISSRITKDFLIQNMEERLWVSQRLSIGKKEKNEWINQQLFFCYKYYLGGSKPAFKEQWNVIWWMLGHGKINVKFCIRLLYTTVKYNLQKR